MLYSYKVIDQQGVSKNGEIEAADSQLAMTALQRRGFIVVSVEKKVNRGKGVHKSIKIFDRVPLKDVVIMSRQVATLFDAQVSAVKAFTLVAENASNVILRDTLDSVAQDIQGGLFISQAMAKYPKIFSDFYVNMVRAGEESGKLNSTFVYLADYLERNYELVSKTRNAMVYPIFVVFTFIIVMILMLTVIIPRLSEIIIESGGDIPVYTKVVIGMSDFLVNYGIFLLMFVVVAGVILWRRLQSKKGRLQIDALKLKLPYFGDLFNKLYLSRISDNMTTMLSAGIPVVRTLEITGSVVDNHIYKQVINQSIEDVKAGSFISDAFAKHKEIPNILVQMIKVGEETGSLGEILKTLSRFYKREVENAVDTLIGLIEPAMIIMLGVGVGFLLTSVLVPIYNIAGGI